MKIISPVLISAALLAGPLCAKDHSKAAAPPPTPVYYAPVPNNPDQTFAASGTGASQVDNTAINQVLFDGQAAMAVNLVRVPGEPKFVYASVSFRNFGSGLIPLDEAKIFLLDGQGRQLHRWSLEELNYATQAWVARNWRSGNYPHPNPPPAHPRYTVVADSMGNYTLNQMGPITTLSGSSVTTYTAVPQPDYSQTGYMLGYAIGRLIRENVDRNFNQRLVQQAEQITKSNDAHSLKTQSPVIPGEVRTGRLRFSVEDFGAAPFKLVVFLTDPRTKVESSTTFEFHSQSNDQASMQPIRQLGEHPTGH
jgi:hypothetical protein